MSETKQASVEELRRAAHRRFGCVTSNAQGADDTCTICALTDRLETAEQQVKQWSDATEFQGLRAEKAEQERDRLREALADTRLVLECGVPDPAKVLNA